MEDCQTSISKTQRTLIEYQEVSKAYALYRTAIECSKMFKNALSPKNISNKIFAVGWKNKCNIDYV